MNPASKSSDQSLSDSPTGCSAVAHATVDTEQLISHSRAALVDTVASLLGSNDGMIAALKCMNYLLRLMTFWECAVSKQVGNLAHILAYLFKTASRQVFPFLTTLRILFLLVRLAFMVTSTGLWHRLTYSSV